MTKSMLEDNPSPPAMTLPAVDATTFRHALAQVCAPVSVVTVLDESRPHGTTVSAFTSLSAEPPLILVCLAEDSDLLALLRRANRFGVNLLGINQSDLAFKFAGKGLEKFVGVPWYLDQGLPRIGGAGVWLACDLTELLPGGDHTIVVGRVTSAATVDGANPLTYHGRGFGTHVGLPKTSS
jgi:flavin reductase (DIM6/NTAB) family NADH-FMN oxidoreductase RutF